MSLSPSHKNLSRSDRARRGTHTEADPEDYDLSSTSPDEDHVDGDNDEDGNNDDNVDDNDANGGCLKEEMNCLIKADLVWEFCDLINSQRFDLMFNSLCIFHIDFVKQSGLRHHGESCGLEHVDCR